MAKTSVKARQRKREAMVARYAAKRAALKKAGDWKALDDLPNNSSKVRLKNRCHQRCLTCSLASSILVGNRPWRTNCSFTACTEEASREPVIFLPSFENA